MSTLHVCPLSRLPETVAAVGASHVATLMGSDPAVARPASIAPENHLILAVNDIVEATEGLTLATSDHLGRFIGFVRGWDRARPMVIHCWAGVSRSTAGAYIAACALMPERDEVELAQVLRRQSPIATPNARFVRIADALLGRDGRMIAAIEAIGRGADAFEGEPFLLTEVGARR